MSDFSDDDEEELPQVQEKSAKIEKQKKAEKSFEYIATEPFLTIENEENKFAKPVQAKNWWFIRTETFPLPTSWENKLK